MIRSTCAVVFSFVVATVFVTAPQSTEAKDRRWQPRCCPQPVYCQPQPTCCQPASICCFAPPVKAPVDVCPQYRWADLGGGNYSYYALRCDTYGAVSLTAGDIPTPQQCGSGNNPNCPDINFELFRPKNARKGAGGHVIGNVNQQPDEYARDRNIRLPTVATSNPGDLRRNEQIDSAYVRIRRDKDKPDVPGNRIYLRLDKYLISGIDGGGNLVEDVVLAGIEVRKNDAEEDPPVSGDDVDRIHDHAAFVTYRGLTYLVTTNKKIRNP